MWNFNDVKSIRYISSYVFRIVFDDGLEGDVDFSEYLDKGPVSVDSNLIDQAALRGEMIRIADMPTDPRVQYPEEARREGIVSSLVCGMVYRGKSVGVIRVYTGEPHAFSAYEESLLRAVAS